MRCSTSVLDLGMLSNSSSAMASLMRSTSKAYGRVESMIDGGQAAGQEMPKAKYQMPETRVRVDWVGFG